MAVIRFAFLRVNQNLVSVVDPTKPLLCLSLIRGWSAIRVGLKCPFLVRSSDWGQGSQKEISGRRGKNTPWSGVASFWISKVSYRSVDMMVVHSHVVVPGCGLQQPAIVTTTNASPLS